MLKFAAAEILSAHPSTHGRSTLTSRTAHRADFSHHAVRPGYLYVRSRAISSRCNDNWDEFPSEEIAKAYRTFVGKPVFVNHVNHDTDRARGVIIDAALHRDHNPDGTPDTWVEVLMEVDGAAFPKLAQAILDGHVDRTSMGCDVDYSICSACGNKATNPQEYCKHIPGAKGTMYATTDRKTGARITTPIREICYGLRFFENSLLVEPPADPTAHFLGVDATGLDKTAGAQLLNQDLLHAEAAWGNDGIAAPRTGAPSGEELHKSDLVTPPKKFLPYLPEPERFLRHMWEQSTRLQIGHGPDGEPTLVRAPGAFKDRARAKIREDWTRDTGLRSECTHPGCPPWACRDNPGAHTCDHCGKPFLRHPDGRKTRAGWDYLPCFHHTWDSAGHPEPSYEDDPGFYQGHHIGCHPDAEGHRRNDPVKPTHKPLPACTECGYPVQLIDAFGGHGPNCPDIFGHHPGECPANGSPKTARYSDIGPQCSRCQHVAGTGPGCPKCAITKHQKAAIAELDLAGEGHTMLWQYRDHGQDAPTVHGTCQNCHRTTELGAPGMHGDNTAEPTAHSGPCPATSDLHRPDTGDLFTRTVPYLPDPAPPHRLLSTRTAGRRVGDYTTCDQGHSHWDPDQRGGAGLLIVHHQPDGPRILLGKRADWIQHGGTWGIPGGAIADGENPTEAAIREAGEELGGNLPPLRHIHTHVDDHGGWKYHTLIAEADHRLRPDAGDHETDRFGWFHPRQLATLDLHPGFAASWPHLAPHITGEQHTGARRIATASAGDRHTRRLDALADHMAEVHRNSLAELRAWHAMGELDDRHLKDHDRLRMYDYSDRPDLLHQHAEGDDAAWPGIENDWEYGDDASGAHLAALRAEAMPPRHTNPADHPFFQAHPVSAANVVAHWAAATPEEKNQGARWYSDAHLLAKALADTYAGGNTAKAAGVISAYSPRTSWAANMHNAARALKEGRALGVGEGISIMGVHHDLAKKIMEQGHYDTVLKGPKTHAFAALIHHGGIDPDTGVPMPHVVIDRHALSVAAGERLSEKDAEGFPSSTAHYYNHVANTYRDAADAISRTEGHTVAPHQVQATTWLVRIRHNQDEDRELRGGGGKGRVKNQENNVRAWNDLHRDLLPGGAGEGNMHMGARHRVEAMGHTAGDDDYRFQHTAPDRNGVPLHQFHHSDQIDPRNVYDNTGADRIDAETTNAIAAADSNPRKRVTIYRAVPPHVTTINPGDWVTLSASFARDHAEARRHFHVLKTTAEARHIHTDGNDLNEWGYNGPATEGRIHWKPPTRAYAPDYAGGAVVLSPDDHAFIHDPSRPVAERAHRLLTALPKRWPEAGLLDVSAGYDKGDWSLNKQHADCDADESAEQLASGGAPTTRYLIHSPEGTGDISGVSWAAHTPGRDYPDAGWKDYTDHRFGERTATAHTAYGETKAPAQVDTLREDACPVCDNTEGWDGVNCNVCLFMSPPSIFMDPDTSVARTMDLRGTGDAAGQTALQQGMDAVPGGLDQAAQNPADGQVTGEVPGGTEQTSPGAIEDPTDATADGEVRTLGDGTADPTGATDVTGPAPEQPMSPAQMPPGADLLTCPACGFQTPAGPPVSTITDNPALPASAGPVAGDVCPNCGKAILVSQAEEAGLTPPPAVPADDPALDAQVAAEAGAPQPELGGEEQEPVDDDQDEAADAQAAPDQNAGGKKPKSPAVKRVSTRGKEGQGRS